MRMHDPAHPGEIARDSLEAEGWTVNECAARLGVSRITLSRLLNGRAVFLHQWRLPWSG